METGGDCNFIHDTADVTMVSFVLEAAKFVQSVTRMPSGDTDVFVLFVYCVNGADLQCKVQMDCWDGPVLDIMYLC